MKTDEAELCDTSRLECFSDGAFAIIITLLVLEIHRPDAAQGALAKELLDQWPSYLAYAVAFVYVGVIWLNHHSPDSRHIIVLDCSNLGVVRPSDCCGHHLHLGSGLLCVDQSRNSVWPVRADRMTELDMLPARLICCISDISICSDRQKVSVISS
jgi:hypothetical protein